MKAIAIEPPKATPEEERAELRMSRLWARMDNLDAEMLQQKEKLKVLEKGFMLGLLPEELRGEYEKSGLIEHQDSKPKKKKDKEKLTMLSEEPKTTDPAADTAKKAEHEEAKNQKSLAATAQLSAEEEALFQKRLAAAQGFFNSGQFGRAIAEYEAIGVDFPVKAKEGSQNYWIALSWTQLKEFDTAQNLFIKFIDSYPGSPWIPRAKLNLAKIQTRLGLREKALKTLREVIETYPNEDAAEMAKLEIRNLEKAL